MPALPIDWPEVKTLALAIGVREAARRMGLSEEVVKKRCTREGWLQDRHAPAKAMQAAIAAKAEVVRVASPQVPTAAEVLASMGQKTRAALAAGILRGSERVARLDPDEIIERAQGVHSLAKSASLVHGWQDGQHHGGQVLVNLDLRGLELPAQTEKACSAPTAVEIESEIGNV